MWNFVIKIVVLNYGELERVLKVRLIYCFLNLLFRRIFLKFKIIDFLFYFIFVGLELLGVGLKEKVFYLNLM